MVSPEFQHTYALDRTPGMRDLTFASAQPSCMQVLGIITTEPGEFLVPGVPKQWASRLPVLLHACRILTSRLGVAFRRPTLKAVIFSAVNSGDVRFSRCSGVETDQLRMGLHYEIGCIPHRHDSLARCSRGEPRGRRYHDVSTLQPSRVLLASCTDTSLRPSGSSTRSCTPPCTNSKSSRTRTATGYL